MKRNFNSRGKCASRSARKSAGRDVTKLLEQLETRRLFSAGATQIQTIAAPQDNNPLVVFQNEVYFSGENNSGHVELYKTNGVTTKLAANIYPTGNADPANLTVVGNTLYFTANDGVHGTELWSTNGTTTSMVDDINPGAGGSNPYDLTAVGNNLYFVADDGVHGNEVWRTNGTLNGTVEIANPGGSPASGTNPSSLTALGNTLYFAAKDGAKGQQLFDVSGASTSASVVKVIDKDGTNANGGAQIYDIIANGNEIYFAGTNGVNGIQIWQSNGTSAGTFQLPDINTSGGSGIYNLTVFNNELYFGATDGVNGVELWRSSSLSKPISNFILVSNINPSGDSDPYDFTALKGELYFFADDGTDGTQLWKTNGTTAGTTMVTDIVSLSGNPDPAYLVVTHNELYFTADGLDGYQVFTDNGSGEAQQVTEVSSPEFLIVSNINNQLFFETNPGGGSTYELWTTQD